MHLPFIIFAICSARAEESDNKPAEFAFYRKDQRIINGIDVDISQLPWMAQIIFETSAGTELCGGAVIHEEYVITAAHCLENLSKRNLEDLFVVLGSTEIYSSAPRSKRKQVKEVHVHEYYNNRKIINDIGLLRIEPAEKDLVPKFIKIKESGSEDIGINEECKVAGWGMTSNFGSIAQRLQAVTVNPLTHEACNKAWKPIKKASQFCALGDRPRNSDANSDSCLGDSGGPLFCQIDGEIQLAGIVSFGGAKCGDPKKPGVYTRASFFEEWIREKVPIPTSAPSIETTSTTLLGPELIDSKKDDLETNSTEETTTLTTANDSKMTMISILLYALMSI
ncbi:Oidioi.mRNA.OKI2018_I69.chr1.g1074.t1.cds [Oikopleura dioica]|uniref:Oidioi.mRNA.OKI2018_I69.chr1.g1074.t1.cds n=1 Tax=Oikopleura dioica TaxID=34765 RepID=A0ABN7SRU2_OIKDI|nr:Oidioi.mRNA.OKI2018_I69.chr1.g1074.t1.cds [Oikopleura dioica]